jgi:hypothetical protein
MSYVIAILAGALCLPATYNLVRTGSLPFALALLVLLAASGGALACLTSRESVRLLPLRHVGAFVLGALAVELISFSHYYLSIGRHDPKLSAGIALSLIEFGVTALVGGIFVPISWHVARRLTSA